MKKKFKKKIGEKSNNAKKCFYGIFIGRFQPFHLGHLRDVKKALTTVDFLIIVLGSAQEKRTERNPLSAAERKKIIQHTLTAENIPKTKYFICTVNDFDKHYLWIAEILKTSKKVKGVNRNNTIVFCGTESSGHFTAKLLAKKGYKIIKLKLLRGISGTRIRKLIFERKRWGHLVPASIRKEIQSYLKKRIWGVSQ
ncbi:adenylyltransferase/cytidyltransferase family protein [Candidatus Woesearchaeota archaeon]|nr:adenylyltransferase/cytidyltransferase family protein [Candidatus Woesearchaeota archaeon]